MKKIPSDSKIWDKECSAESISSSSKGNVDRMADRKEIWSVKIFGKVIENDDKGIVFWEKMHARLKKENVDLKMTETNQKKTGKKSKFTLIICCKKNFEI